MILFFLLCPLVLLIDAMIGVNKEGTTLSQGCKGFKKSVVYVLIGFLRVDKGCGKEKWGRVKVKGWLVKVNER